MRTIYLLTEKSMKLSVQRHCSKYSSLPPKIFKEIQTYHDYVTLKSHQISTTPTQKPKVKIISRHENSLEAITTGCVSS